MRIEIKTIEPGKLKDDIFQKAKKDVLKTWDIRQSDSKEEFLTHTGQWIDEALLEFSVKNNEQKLVITISWWAERGEPTEVTKGIYLGRFSEALLNHFNKGFSSFEIFYK